MREEIAQHPAGFSVRQIIVGEELAVDVPLVLENLQGRGINHWLALAGGGRGHLVLPSAGAEASLAW